MNLICFIIGHKDVGINDIPWGVICERCGSTAFEYDGRFAAGPYLKGDKEWSEMNRSERKAYNQKLTIEAKCLNARLTKSP